MRMGRGGDGNDLKNRVHVPNQCCRRKLRYRRRVDIIAVMDFGRNQRQVAILRGQFRVLSIW